MIALLLGLSVTFIALCLSRRQPVIVPALAIVMLVLMPRVATRSWLAGSGDLANIHPAVWLLVGGCFFAIAFKWNSRVPRHKTRRQFVILSAWLFLGGTLSSFAHGFSLSFLINFLLPSTAFFAVVLLTSITADGWLVLRRTVVMLAATQSLLAVFEYWRGAPLLYEQYYSEQFWYSQNHTRSLGTFDSPLDLATFLTCSMTLAVQQRARWALGYTFLLISGIAVSGSRVGIVIGLIVMLLTLSRHWRHPRVAVISGLAVLAAFVLLSVTGLADPFTDRFGRRGETSNTVRADALAEGLRLTGDKPWFGYGPGYSYDYSLTHLRSSFENAYLASAIDYGLPFAIALVIISLYLAQPLKWRLFWASPGLIAIVWGFAFSSILSSSNFAVISWFFVGISALLITYPTRLVSADKRLRAETGVVPHDA